MLLLRNPASFWYDCLVLSRKVFAQYGCLSYVTPPNALLRFDWYDVDHAIESYWAGVYDKIKIITAVRCLIVEIDGDISRLDRLEMTKLQQF